MKIIIFSIVIIVALAYNVGKVPNWAKRQPNLPPQLGFLTANYFPEDGHVDNQGFTHRYIKAEGQTTIHVMTIGDPSLPKLVIQTAIPASPLALRPIALIMKEFRHVVIYCEKGLGNSVRPTTEIPSSGNVIDHKSYHFNVLAKEFISVIDQYLGSESDFDYMCIAEGCLAYWHFHETTNLARIKSATFTAVHSPSGVNPGRGRWYASVANNQELSKYLQYECGEGIGSVVFQLMYVQMSKGYTPVNEYYKLESAEFISRGQGGFQNLIGKFGSLGGQDKIKYMGKLYIKALNDINAGVYNNTPMLHIAGGFFGGHSTDLFDGSYHMHYDHPLDTEGYGYREYDPDNAKNWEDHFPAGNLKLQWYPSCGQQTYLEKTAELAQDILLFTTYPQGYTLTDDKKFCGYDDQIYELGGKWCNQMGEQCECVNNNLRQCSGECTVSDYKRISDIRDGVFAQQYHSEKNPNPMELVQGAMMCHYFFGMPQISDPTLAYEYKTKADNNIGVHQQMLNDVDDDLHPSQ